MSDWIDSYMTYTEGIPSPRIFRLWAAITAVAGVLERRVWVETSKRRSVLYPHLYTLLVSPPGIGKSQAIEPIGDLWSSLKDLKVAPDNVTKPALMDALGRALRTLRLNGSQIIEFHSMVVKAAEFGVFLSSHDLEFLSALNFIYDTPRRYLEERRHSLKDPLEISYPQLTILAGSQPGFLSSLLPEEAWTMGFCSRLIMVYSGTSPEIELFSESDAGEEFESQFKALLGPLNALMKLYGPFSWEPEAQLIMKKFNSSHKESAPDHSKLQHYCARRVQFAIKLSMISAASSTQSLLITPYDVKRGLKWMLEAEATMPDIFREMQRRSDNDVLVELHRFTWAIWRDTRKPIHEARIYNFLRTHLPADRIPKVFDLAQKANIVQRAAGHNDLFIPRPSNEHGLE